MKTRIKLKNLQLDTIIGICEWEKHAQQTLLFNVEIEFEQCSAMLTDQIDGALDYATVAEDIRRVVEASGSKLLESLLWEIAGSLFKGHALIETLSIAVDKPQAISNAEAACVELLLSREEFERFIKGRH